jgi:hypothetical protein
MFDLAGGLFAACFDGVTINKHKRAIDRIATERAIGGVDGENDELRLR